MATGAAGDGESDRALHLPTDMARPRARRIARAGIGERSLPPPRRSSFRFSRFLVPAARLMSADTDRGPHPRAQRRTRRRLRGGDTRSGAAGSRAPLVRAGDIDPSRAPRVAARPWRRDRRARRRRRRSATTRAIAPGNLRGERARGRWLVRGVRPRHGERRGRRHQCRRYAVRCDSLRAERACGRVEHVRGVRARHGERCGG